MYFKSLISITIIYIFFLMSCDYVEPIFYSIANEEKIQTNNLYDEVTTIGMAKVGNFYFAGTGGAIFYLKDDSNSWTQYTLPGGYEGVSSLVQFDTDLAYAVLVKDYYSDITGYGLYSITPGGNVATFTKIRETDSSHQMKVFTQVDNTHVLTNNLIAMVGSVSSGWTYYEQYHTASPEKLEVENLEGSGTFSDNTETVITGVAQAGPGGTTFVATAGALYELNAASDQLNIVSVQTSSAVPRKGNISALFYSSKYSTLYLAEASSSDGGSYIWSSTDAGATWNRNGKYGSSYFSAFTEIDQTDFSGVLVGTRFFPTIGKDEGYFEMENGDFSVSLAIPTGNKYTSGTLDTSGVMGFFVDTSNDRLYVLTSNRGLWRGTYSAGRSIDWILE